MTNIVPDERIVLRVPSGTRAKLMRMARESKIKNLSVLVRKLINEGIEKYYKGQYDRNTEADKPLAVERTAVYKMQGDNVCGYDLD